MYSIRCTYKTLCSFSWASCEYVRRVTINDKSVLHKKNYTIRTRLGEYSLSETTLLCCIWHIALALELNQLVITRSAELHNEGSAAPSTEQGNPATLWFFTLCLLFKVITLMPKCRKTIALYAVVLSILMSIWSVLSSNEYADKVGTLSLLFITCRRLCITEIKLNRLSIAIFTISLIAIAKSWESLVKDIYRRGFSLCKIFIESSVNFTFVFFVILFLRYVKININ